MKQTNRVGRKRIVKYIIPLILLLPVSAAAFLGIGDSGDAVLAAILAQLKEQSLTLMDLFGGIDFIDSQVSDMRRRINDPISLSTSGLIERLGKLDQMIPGADTLGTYTYPLINGSKNVDDVVKTIESAWGSVSNTDYGKILRFKDYIPTYAFSQTALIEEESEGFAHTGGTILDDLDDAEEGKATLRTAQASALQVQQLAQIESNQALQLSLQSQQVLSDNEREKSLQDIAGVYLQMLSDNYQSLSAKE